MNLLDAAAIKRVQAIGYRVVNPSDPPDLAEARRALVASGYRVFPPLSAPPVDSVWKPTRGLSLLRRQALAFDNGHVTYQTPDAPAVTPQRIALRSWDLWRQRTRAKRVAP